MDMKANLQAMLERGQDSALLRFSLGELCLRDGENQAAAEHLARAVALKPDYSAAWKLYGRALAAAARREEARQAFEEGIRVAEQAGDRQAAKEMTVFLRRLQRD